jgi:hypothetical protein
MFTVGPNFFSSGVAGVPPASLGAISPTGLSVCRIDATRALVTYNNNAFTQTFAVVATVVGSEVVVGTPVSLTDGTINWVNNARPLNDAAGDGEYVLFGQSTGGSNLFARVINVSGTTITLPYSTYSVFPGVGSASTYGEVLSPTQIGAVFQQSGGGFIRGIAATVASGVVTWGTSVVASRTGPANFRPKGSPPKRVSGGVDVWFDMYDGVLATNLNVVRFSFVGTTCTVGTPWMPAASGDRIQTWVSSPPSIGMGAVAQTGLHASGMAMLYRDFGTGTLASVRGEFNSGVTGSYNHGDSAPYFVQASPPAPYAPPPIASVYLGTDTSISVASNPSFTNYTVTYRDGIAGYYYTCSLSGEIDPVANPVLFAASGLGTTSSVVHTYLSSTVMLLLYRSHLTPFSLVALPLAPA